MLLCDIIFICKNGTLSCHSQIISVFSDFFQDKIRACENMGNKLDFDYKDYEKKVIKSYLDRLYSIETWIKPLNHAEKLKLLQFLHFEGKTDLSGELSNLDFFVKPMGNFNRV